jgi:uncharacterized RDD family membrane protein YckC
MDAVEEYIDAVMHNIHAPLAERQRIAGDLRAHLAESIQAGDSPKSAIAHMGSPLEVAAEFMAQVRLGYAGFWIRLLAFAVDLLLIVLCAGTLAVLAIYFSNRVPPSPQGLDYVTGAVWIILVVSCALSAVGTILLYFPILEGRFGWTPGKRLFGLHVLKENGLPIGYKEAFLRRISFYFEVLPVDALFIPFNSRRQRAFDIVARTVVVRYADK